MNEKLNLEVGKKYVRRDGEVVAVKLFDGMLRAGEWYYFKDGICAGFPSNDDKTIVAEYTEDDPDGDVTLCDDVVEEIVIEPGALVPPEHLWAARKMFRDGVEFFITAKGNGTDRGFLLAADLEWHWDDSRFYVRRGPRDAWLKADAEPEATPSIELEVGKTFLTREGYVVEINEQLDDSEAYDFLGSNLTLMDDDEYTADGHYFSDCSEHELDLIEEIASIAPGEAFTCDDADKVRTAKLMQEQGVVFEAIRFADLNDKWTAGNWDFSQRLLPYRRQPVDVAECQDKDTTPDDSQQELRLEVGKSYRNRNGQRVDVVGRYADAESDGTGWQFEGLVEGDNETCYYCSNGQFWQDGSESDEDLIEEIGLTSELDGKAATVGGDVTYTLTGTELRREMLRQVESCVCRDRQNTYGDAEDNFANIAAIANVALQRKLAAPLEAEDVAIFSLCIKIARLIESPHHIDNWIDAGGYAVCGAGIMKRKELNEKTTQAAEAV